VQTRSCKGLCGTTEQSRMRIGFALIAVALLLPLQVSVQKGVRSSSHSSRSSSTKTTKSSVPKEINSRQTTQQWQDQAQLLCRCSSSLRRRSTRNDYVVQFSFSESNASPFFQIARARAAIFRANVSRAISARMPLRFRLSK